jgi:hypothetical protein
MEFRWVMGITLWTFLSGPVFGPPMPHSSRSQAGPNRVVQKEVVRPSPSPVRGMANASPGLRR